MIILDAQFKNMDFSKWAVIPTEEDGRDYDYAVKVMRPNVTSGLRPRKVKNRNLTIRNQGYFGTCTGHSGSYGSNLREGVITSPLALYYFTKVVDRKPKIEGSDMRSLMKAWNQYGICREDLYPYHLYKNAHDFPPMSSEALADARNRRIEAYARVSTLEEILDAIWRYKSIVGAIIIFNNFYEPHEGYVYPTLEGDFVGAHAVHFSGYDLDLEHTYPNGRKEKGFLWMDNSWGSEWGIEGGCWYPISLLKAKVKLPGKIFSTSVTFDFFAPIEAYPSSVEWHTMKVAPFRQGAYTYLPVEYVNNHFPNTTTFEEDSSDFRYMPIYKDGHAFVPMDGILMSGYIKFDQAEQRIDFIIGDNEVSMWIGQLDYMVKKGVKR